MMLYKISIWWFWVDVTTKAGNILERFQELIFRVDSFEFHSKLSLISLIATSSMFSGLKIDDICWTLSFRFCWTPNLKLWGKVSMRIVFENWGEKICCSVLTCKPGDWLCTRWNPVEIIMFFKLFYRNNFFWTIFSYIRASIASFVIRGSGSWIRGSDPAI